MSELSTGHHRDPDQSRGRRRAVIEAWPYIDHSRVLVLVFSSNSNGSAQVRREVERGVLGTNELTAHRLADVHFTEASTLRASGPRACLQELVLKCLHGRSSRGGRNRLVAVKSGRIT
jgi:hypothetical protein